MNEQGSAWRLLPRILLQVLPVAAVVLVGTWAIAERVTVDTVAGEVRKRLELAAGKRAAAIEQQLTSLRRAALTLALNDLIINSLVDRAAAETDLPTFFQSWVAPGLSGAELSLLDYRGRFIATSATSENYVDAAWLPAVMASQRHFSVDQSGLLIAEPVFYEGAPEGVIVLRYAAADLAGLVDLDEQAPLAIFDANNGLLHAWGSAEFAADPRAFLSDSQWVHAQTILDGPDKVRIVSFVRSDQSLSVLSNIRLAAQFNVVFSLLALFGGIVLAAWLAARPVARMSRELQVMGRSADLSQRLSVVGAAELRTLAQTFNALLARLEESTTSRESLEIEVCERAAAQEALRRKARELQMSAEELQRSNQDLERFAYIASHDLQEPLRMVSNYAQLLQKRYEGQLDETADQFIGFAVNGTKRMQTLLTDLLEYSRYGRHIDLQATTDVNKVVKAAITNLQKLISDAKVRVEVASDLPMVAGDAGQLTRLFQNLIANAVKFRAKTSPWIAVTACKHDEHSWRFEVRDNGIGLEEAFAKRVFEIFQRLHGVDEYPGTGIGLAICKRVVDAHHGTIWVDSKPGEGAVFSFTLRATSSGEFIVADGQAA